VLRAFATALREAFDKRYAARFKRFATDELAGRKTHRRPTLVDRNRVDPGALSAEEADARSLLRSVGNGSAQLVLHMRRGQVLSQDHYCHAAAAAKIHPSDRLISDYRSRSTSGHRELLSLLAE
jgi:hypothetical protein